MGRHDEREPSATGNTPTVDGFGEIPLLSGTSDALVWGMASDSLELLCKQRRHHGELSHALRHLWRVGQRLASAPSIDQRSPSSGSASGLGLAWPRDGGDVWNLDEAVGQDVAKAWTSFLQSVTSRPRYIPTLARATGPQSYEVFAYLSCCCIEDPLAMGAQPGSACATVKVAAALITQSVMRSLWVWKAMRKTRKCSN